ncbi:Flp pilus assembly protein, protease CpaA [Candidatus Methanoperedens nitroreducens]|uniref:Flp pilus assembly protein, protease CpaA n=1 Tax=Candidatus Methanoperedens nitratireducens TaxID=1392998 RepID=A0A062VB27_9EURY|nr:A24 family peptidase C-terminal domain-containing protein [Candidatus Methanoperedens nitroreducens]KCZ72904.1 Flp pilus assembly protein, protease CpaA [Candidatus Methanoperedens nitroreducens]MDJ1423168.1 A24 family peptidase C-terminal domain-containing protein [Candidatus Methanoperedens sp.]
MLDILKISFCIPFLLYSCYSDIKTRRVTNNLWLVMLVGSIFFILYDVSREGIGYLPGLFISTGFIFLLVYIFFQLGTFGGADAKSLIVLSLILPAYPTFQAFGYIFPLNKPLIDIFALGIFGNAVLLTIVVPAGLAVLNIIKMGLHIDKPAYIFVGYKSRISELSGKHVRLIQDYEVINGEVRFYFKRGGVEINEKNILELKALSEKGLIDEEVWVTPSLPFMIPITAGFLVAVSYGDLILELTKYLL